MPPPSLLKRWQAKHFADREILHVQVGQTLQGPLNRKGDVVNVGKLIGQNGDWTRPDANDLVLAIAKINNVASCGFLADAVQE